MSESEAISKVILEFGEARVLNAGMVKVHTMPKMIKGFLLAGLISSVALVHFSSSLAEILTSSVGPYPTCPEDIFNYATVGDCSSESAWMRLSDFATDITKAGGEFAPTKIGFVVKFPDDQEIPVFLLKSSDFDLGNSLGMIKGDVQFQKNTETWVNVTEVINTIAEKSTLPVKLEGWENPSLHVGKTTLKLVTEGQSQAAFYAYTFGMMRQISREGDRKTSPIFTIVSPTLATKSDLTLETLAKFKHKILVNDKPGAIYAAITKNYERLTSISIAPVAADGTLTLLLQHSKVNFVDTLEKLDPYQRMVDPPAVLVKLSGRLDTRAPKMEIVVPPTKQSTSK